MLSRRPDGPPPDPDQRMVGKCASCGTVVRCRRRAATEPRSGGEPGVWQELPYIGCPGCEVLGPDGKVKGQARVYLIAAKGG